jgi:pimeloyl-ACP methyl ester carboxylesterase
MPKTRIGDIDLYYEVHGTGEPLVLIHGLSLDSSVWVNQVSVFSQKYQVIILDNRGVGQADDPPGDYSVEMMAADTAGLLKFLNITEAHILGFSLGGMIAQTMALTYPGLVKSLLLAATAARLPARARHLMQVWLRMLAEKVPPDLWFQDIFPWVYTDEFFENDDNVQAMLNLALNHPYPQSAHGFAGQVAALTGHDTRAQIQQISVPTLVLVGRDDILSPVKYSEEIAAKIPRAQLTILEPGGHNCWLEFSDLFNQAVLQFLETIP